MGWCGQGEGGEGEGGCEEDYGGFGNYFEVVWYNVIESSRIVVVVVGWFGTQLSEDWIVVAVDDEFDQTGADVDFTAILALY